MTSAKIDPPTEANAGPTPDTWFMVAEALDAAGKPAGMWFVVRLDRATLPDCRVVSTGHPSQEAAERVAAQMRQTGTA